MEKAASIKQLFEHHAIATSKAGEILDLPTPVLNYLLEPEKNKDSLFDWVGQKLAAAARNTPASAQPSPAKEPTNARFSAIRSFLLRRLHPQASSAGTQALEQAPFGIVEQNLVLQLAILALEDFRQTNASVFGFETYLFKHHSNLLRRFRQKLLKLDLEQPLLQHRLQLAQSNVFACDNLQNICIIILDDFCAELESLLLTPLQTQIEQTLKPFIWQYDQAVSSITIFTDEGSKRTEKIVELLHRARTIESNVPVDH